MEKKHIFLIACVVILSFFGTKIINTVSDNVKQEALEKESQTTFTENPIQADTPTSKTTSDSSNTQSGAAEPEEDLITQELAEMLNAYDTYKDFPVDKASWAIENLSEYSQRSDNFINLYLYTSIGKYAETIVYTVGDGNGAHNAGDSVTAFIYLTKTNEEDYTIHKITLDTYTLTDDGYVTQEMLAIINGVEDMVEG